MRITKQASRTFIREACFVMRYFMSCPVIKYSMAKALCLLIVAIPKLYCQKGIAAFADSLRHCDFKLLVKVYCHSQHEVGACGERRVEVVVLGLVVEYVVDGGIDAHALAYPLCG